MNDFWMRQVDGPMDAEEFSDRMELDYRRYARRLEQEEIG